MSSVTVCQCVILLETPDVPAWPVPLMPCGDRPFLAWGMRELQRFGVEEFVFLTRASSPEVVSALESLADQLPRPAKITVCNTPAGSGLTEALRQSRPHLRQRFLMCPAHILFSGNLAPFLSVARQGNWRLLCSKDEQEHVSRKEDETVCPEVKDLPDSIRTGICLLEVSILDQMSDSACLWEILSSVRRTGNLHSYLSDGAFYDIKTVQDLAQAADILPRLLRRSAVFLDRDGVINRDFGWVGTRDRFEWEPGALETIASLTQSGYHVFIVTNQSGIARGFYSESDLQTLMTWVIDTIRSQGGTIDDWRYCPMHPEAPLPQYRAACENRKPAPGMIVDLMQTWSLDPDRCVLFGDQPSDMQAAAAARIQSVLVGPSRLSQLVAEGHHLKI